MSSDPTPANAAKRTPPTTAANKAHNTPPPAKTGPKKAAPSKAGAAPGASASPEPQAASPLANRERHDIVLALLTGQIDPVDLVELSVEVQALLATVMLEQRRPVSFDANSTYTGPDNFADLIGQLLGGPPRNRVISVMKRMRQDGAYTSKGKGVRAVFTFPGTDQARKIVQEVQTYHRSVEESQLTGPTPGPVATTPPEYAVAAPQVGLGTPELDRHTISELLAAAIAENAWRQAGYDPHVIDLVIMELQNRRFV